MALILTMDWWIIFFIFLLLIFSNKKFNYKMNEFTYSGDLRINSEANLKNSLTKIFILYSILSLTIFYF